MTQQARGRERREQIIAAAQEVLLREGITGLTHRSVATQAGVPLGSTTYYFTDRAELVRAAVDAFLVAEQQRRGRITAQQPTLTAVASSLVTLMLPPPVDDPAHVAHLYQRYTEALSDPELATLLREDGKDLRVHARRLLGIVGLEAHTEMVVALVDGRMIQWMASPASRRRLVSTIADDLSHITH